MYFSYGDVYYYFKSYGLYARAVRGRQSGSLGYLVISPATIDYGVVEAGQVSEQSITVLNDGDAEIAVASVILVGDDVFSISADNCLDQNLAPGANCTVLVSFSPDSAGDYSGSVIVDSEIGQRHSASLTGAGESFYGQDAQHHGPPRSYTKLDGTGNDLSDAAEAWTMVRDNVTGLTWEVKTDDGGIHDRDNTYSWCDTNGTSNGGYAGTCGAGTDTEDFIASLNVANYGGYSDWRLPTVQELVSLVDASIPYPGPTINTDFFPGTQSSSYWSSTTLAYYNEDAWYVDFGHGYVHPEPGKPSHCYARAVRGRQ